MFVYTTNMFRVHTETKSHAILTTLKNTLMFVYTTNMFRVHTETKSHAR